MDLYVANDFGEKAMNISTKGGRFADEAEFVRVLDPGTGWAFHSAITTTTACSIFDASICESTAWQPHPYTAVPNPARRTMC